VTRTVVFGPAGADDDADTDAGVDEEVLEPLDLLGGGVFMTEPPLEVQAEAAIATASRDAMSRQLRRTRSVTASTVSRESDESPRAVTRLRATFD
jgi:hypothetical protein